MTQILDIMIVRNEIDIIEWTTAKLLSMGLSVHILDDWSTDGTYEALDRFRPDITLERFPAAGPTPFWEYTAQLRRDEEIALAHPGSWILPQGADEITFSPWPVPIVEAVQRVEDEGFNFITFLLFDFFPTTDGFARGTDPEEFYAHGRIETNHLYRRFYKQPEGTRADIAGNACHDVQIPNRRIHPEPFITKHWSLRSQAQGERKIRERFARFSPEEKARGWHTHYNHIQEGHNYIADPANFVRFAEVYPHLAGVTRCA